ncbi:hypothetical protein RQM47_06580 [Rubrivirga sp. S365]|uniref:Lasso peptide n=1 Tax=Rubrivirga litoralis TaxID=3075598 RepID=A0ABU3BT17_9BACT|nr:MULTISPECIES: hypothetical protein [unclassified Rubrivirga]MDT0632316.1 hypothetical protein [Rubrivirga sp. F394]MDT7856299.1 hypothetical protein [Rubrivirga sp. S365]
MKPYTSPALIDLGHVRILTAADQTSAQTDQIFTNGQVVGTSNGSLDICTTADDQTCT